MPYTLSLKSLIRLQRHQFSAGKKKRDLIGLIVLLIYFWVLEIVSYFLFKDKDVSVQTYTAVIVCLSMTVPDFLFKLIFVRDQTVMDAFLKTRPILQKQWNRFLTVSQCWKLSNLIMPAIMLLACILFLPFPTGLAVAAGLYILSVLGGILVMQLKRRGTYASEKVVSTAVVRTFKPGRTGHAIFGLQSKSLLRSKRLKRAWLYMSIFFLLEFILYGSMGSIEGGRDRFFGMFYLFGFFAIESIMLSQYGLGIEAGYFGTLWTRPVSISRILRDKFWLGAILGGIGLLITLPFCIWFHISLLIPVSYALYTAGFCSPLLLIDAYNCVPFDLFGKTFFNHQGASGTFKASVVLGTFLLLGLGWGLPAILPGWPSCLIFSILGLIGFVFHRPYFAWVERKFLKDKYKYLEKYQSQ
jgi:hypothetical protein